MLVSHRHQFIFLKTIKTAGTSVEVFFERYCLPPGTLSAEHRAEVVTPLGIVGARPRLDTSEWWNHMQAAHVRAKLGDEVWSRYFRFACVRNPFDAAVSMFWWAHREEPAKFVGLPFAAVRDAFRQWIMSNGPLPTNDRILFDEDGSLAVHDVVRYESLADDVERVCSHLGLDFATQQIGTFKTGIRKSAQPASDYYDGATAELVARRFRHYRDRFGYDLDWRPQKLAPV